jgi:hypothetical protein
MTGYDIIGDMHGCAEMLEGLLGRMGYVADSVAYRHPERQAIFVGDLIDRGAEQVKTLELVRAMVESGSAQIVMGNHEFNAISYVTPDPAMPGEFMRPRNEKNRKQHRAFIEQLELGSRLHAETIDWFKTLPLYLDLDGFRVVHACWNDEAIELVDRWLRPGDQIPADFVLAANRKGTDEHHAIEVLLKGPELSLVEYGQEPFRDKDGQVRSEARIRWWDASAATLAALAEIPPGTTTEDGQPYPPLPSELCTEGSRFSYRSKKPVLYGHYWRVWPPTKGLDWTSNTACVDFSAGVGGPLVAYRWNEEGEILPKNYVDWPSRSE